jgi:N-acetylmuramoyl-L-alanine amidase
MAKIKIAIDAGHGSKTPGKRTAPFTKPVDIDGNGSIDVKKGEQFREHYANVGIANLLFSEISSRGYEAIKTGFNDDNSNDDIDEALSARQKKVKNERCNISISVHFNAAAGNGMSFNSASGVSIYIHDKYTNESRDLAVFVLNELTKGTIQKDRGVSKLSLAMCNCKTMGTAASVLVECAFMTNEREAQELMANAKFWAETAVEIADGLDKYVRWVYLKKPSVTVTQRSSVNDIMWLQTFINEALKSVSGFTLLEVDGDYGNKTKEATLSLWEFLGWNDDLTGTGWRAGKKTINKLYEIVL